jgi:uncharacterized protein YbbC (DUF1343 family)
MSPGADTARLRACGRRLTCPAFRTGAEVLLAEHRDWLQGARLGLVSHAAAVNAGGRTTAALLHAQRDLVLAALFGPEHGFAGAAGAGVATRDQMHADYGIPVFALYGRHTKPTRAMLLCIDTLVVDFQTLPARPYTYVATLRYVLEAAAAAGKRVVVADRPVPLPACVDGPMLAPSFASFVGCVGTPMQYGMTPGEIARWLVHDLRLKLDLCVAPARPYRRAAQPGRGWPHWVAPSPRIRSWASACCYTATVAGEALPALDYGSGTALAFQVLAAPWVPAAALVDAIRACRLPGVAFARHAWVARAGLYANMRVEGLRMRVTDARTFRPVLTGVSMLACLQALGGFKPLWQASGTRPDFFDKLFGTDRVRLALGAGASGADIAQGWTADLAAFRKTRRACLLYPPS